MNSTIDKLRNFEGDLIAENKRLRFLLQSLLAAWNMGEEPSEEVVTEARKLLGSSLSEVKS